LSHCFSRFSSRVGAGALFTAASLAIGPGSTASAVTFNDFADLSDFTLNGATASINTGGQGVVGLGGDRVLRLTNGLGQSGGAFLTDPFSLAADASFSSFFRFQFHDSNGISDADGQGADGIVFVVQPEAADVGSSGGGIGYAGINPSVGVEFDTYNNASQDNSNGNHIGIDLNGSDTNTYQTNIATRFNNGEVWYAWVDYDGSTDTLEARVSQTNLRPVSATVSRTVDLVSVLGQTNAFIGFTSGTGAASNDHDILSWQFEGAFNPLDTSLETIPGDGGTVDFLTRVGDSDSQTVNVLNGGPAGVPDLVGSAGSPSGAPFSGPDEAAAYLLAPGDSTDFTYTFSPNARGDFNDLINISSNDANDTDGHDINFAGQAVGPVVSVTSNVDFGNVDAEGMAVELIDIANNTPDGDLGALTDLTINDILIDGIDSGAFTLLNFTPGQTIAAGDTFQLQVKYSGPVDLGGLAALLTLQTDEGTVLAGDGNDYQIELIGNAVPEPASLALLGVGALMYTRRSRCR
jgi:hypothetical protein